MDSLAHRNCQKRIGAIRSAYVTKPSDPPKTDRGAGRHGLVMFKNSIIKLKYFRIKIDGRRLRKAVQFESLAVISLGLGEADVLFLRFLYYINDFFITCNKSFIT
jgi:hypothetical protein